MNWEVITYAANIIDYIRLVLLFASIFFKGNTFILLYATSVSLDFFDGYVAKAQEKVSTLGATMDMIIDRVTTVVILMKISLEKPDLAIKCILYSAIDLISHFHFFLVSAYTGQSHKSMVSKGLLYIYYSKPLVLGILCLGSELCFIATYLSKTKNSAVKMLQGIAIVKTFFHIVHFFVAIAELSKLPVLKSK